MCLYECPNWMGPYFQRHLLECHPTLNTHPVYVLARAQWIPREHKNYDSLVSKFTYNSPAPKQYFSWKICHNHSHFCNYYPIENFSGPSTMAKSQLVPTLFKIYWTDYRHGINLNHSRPTEFELTALLCISPTGFVRTCNLLVSRFVLEQLSYVGRLYEMCVKQVLWWSWLVVY